MTDRYRNFSELETEQKENRDYRIRSAERNNSVLVMAIHGGKIEPGTTEIASRIAGDDNSYYSFEGIRSGRNFELLHITSSRFDEPIAMDLTSRVEDIISVHGARDPNSEYVMLGGLNEDFIDEARREIEAAGFVVKSSSTGLEGKSPENICNKGRNGRGVQLEISKKLRDSVLSNDDKLPLFCDAVRAAIESYVGMNG